MSELSQSNHFWKYHHIRHAPEKVRKFVKLLLQTKDPTQGGNDKFHDYVRDKTWHEK
jgi:hypothetical protein